MNVEELGRLAAAIALIIIVSSTIFYKSAGADGPVSGFIRGIGICIFLGVFLSVVLYLGQVLLGYAGPGH